MNSKHCHCYFPVTSPKQRGNECLHSFFAERLLVFVFQIRYLRLKSSMDISTKFVKVYQVPALANIQIAINKRNVGCYQIA